jgi:hypothetical protein
MEDNGTSIRKAIREIKTPSFPMDPLTIVSGSIALARSVVSIGFSIATFTQTVRDARGDLSNTRQELANLSLVLESLAQHADSREREIGDSDPLVRRILEVIQDCEKSSKSSRVSSTDMTKACGDASLGPYTARTMRKR